MGNETSSGTMKLLILAGGFGTRLKTVVSDRPKPLAPIGDKPFLYFQIKSWKEQGFRSFIFLLHYQALQVVEFIKHAQRTSLLSDCEVQWIIEDEPLGTGGAIANAINFLKIEGQFIIVNADTWLESGLKRLVTCTSPTIALVSQENGGRYGQVGINSEYKVIHFKEKSNDGDSGLISTGCLKLHPEIFSPYFEKAISLEREIIPQLVNQGILSAIELETRFIDIGIPEDYTRFREWVDQPLEKRN